ncbi:MAG: transposase [Bacteroidetes bacterium]|nr:transposase [Bacteroidota bacterium]
MIPQAKAVKLIEIYFYICKRFEEDLQYCCERFSNNKNPQLSDQEIVTIYLYAVYLEEWFKVKQIYSFADTHLRSWFPKLGSYQAFNNRLNRLSEVFTRLINPLLADGMPDDCFADQSLLDSMPIITCSGKRSAKVAREIADKGVCSSKGMYYLGVKFHALAFRREARIPFPEQLLVTLASVNDLTAFKEAWSEIPNRCFFGDKIFQNSDFFQLMERKFNSIMLTPIKAVKGQSEQERQRLKATNDLFSRAVSRVRQPIESFFCWIIEKTDIQRASKVRSTKGLLTHVFGKIAAAFIHLIF